jgi:hypothetical protein
VPGIDLSAIVWPGACNSFRNHLSILGGLPLRTVVWILLALWCLGWTICQWDIAPAQDAKAQDSAWRRTVLGWEKNTSWKPPPQPYEPMLDPLIVGSLQGLISLLALVTLSPFRLEERPSRAKSRVVSSDRSPVQICAHQVAPADPVCA